MGASDFSPVVWANDRTCLGPIQTYDGARLIVAYNDSFDDPWDLLPFSLSRNDESYMHKILREIQNVVDVICNNVWHQEKKGSSIVLQSGPLCRLTLLWLRGSDGWVLRVSCDNLVLHRSEYEKRGLAVGAGDVWLVRFMGGIEYVSPESIFDQLQRIWL